MDCFLFTNVSDLAIGVVWMQERHVFSYKHHKLNFLELNSHVLEKYSLTIFHF